jgi:hypothetical protein
VVSAWTLGLVREEAAGSRKLRGLITAKSQLLFVKQAQANVSHEQYRTDSYGNN